MDYTDMFRNMVADLIHPLLRGKGYQFQADIATLRPPDVDWDCYLAFSKHLHNGSFVHIVLMHSALPLRSVQWFRVQLLRYSGDRPYEHAIDERGRAVITGDLPIAETPPLPIIIGGGSHRMWRFSSQESLYRQLLLVRQRLDNPIIPWLECPYSHQYMSVEKHWYRDAFAHYVDGSWDGAMAYDAVRDFDPTQFYFRIEAQTPEDCDVVSEILTILRPYSPHSPALEERPPQAALQYLMQCVTGEQTMDAQRYLAQYAGAAHDEQDDDRDEHGT